MAVFGGSIRSAGAVKVDKIGHYLKFTRSKVMRKKVFLSVLLSMVMVSSASAQNFKKGSLDFLKGQDQVKLVFDFSSLTIDGDSEEAYMKERMADEKTPEDAQKWKDEWKGAHRNLFENTFTQYCNDELKAFMVNKSYENAAYTIIVKIIDIDPGNFAGPFSNPSKLRASFKMVKTGEENNVLAVLDLKKIFIRASAFNPVEYMRIEMGFGELGKEFGKQINKVLK